eukprot:258009-Rhodomonas_salina.2
MSARAALDTLKLQLSNPTTALHTTSAKTLWSREELCQERRREAEREEGACLAQPEQQRADDRGGQPQDLEGGEEEVSVGVRGRRRRRWWRRRGQMRWVEESKGESRADQGKGRREERRETGRKEKFGKGREEMRAGWAAYEERHTAVEIRHVSDEDACFQRHALREHRTRTTKTEHGKRDATREEIC